MMEFVITTLSFTVAMVLALLVTGAIGFAIVFNKKFFAWYMKKVSNVTMKVMEESFDFDKEETV